MNSKEAQHHPDTLTQFQRAAQEMSCELITANSPQAKGRVERVFKTLQDRLVKELRLANISDAEEANVFLRDFFLPQFNAQFGVVPKRKVNLHRILNKTEKEFLLSCFSRQTERTVQNDFTLAFQKNWYQLTDDQTVTVTHGSKIIIEERLDGTLMFRLRGQYLKYLPLPQRPRKVCREKTPWVLAKKPNQRTHYKPPANHPWRKPFLKHKSSMPTHLKSPTH